jgi:hypothetical protein
LSPAALIALQPGQTATLLTLVFNTVGLGTSPVNIGVVAIGDENGIPHGSVTTAPGSVTVIGGVIIPEPSSMALVAAAVGLLIWRRRRSRV